MGMLLDVEVALVAPFVTSADFLGACCFFTAVFPLVWPFCAPLTTPFACVGVFSATAAAAAFCLALAFFFALADLVSFGSCEGFTCGAGTAEKAGSGS